MDNETQKKPDVCAYRAFWHLEAVGVLEAELDSNGILENYTSKVWEKLADAPAALVALIDTGVSKLHPYLEKKDKDDQIEQIDLTGLPMNAPEGARQTGSPFEGIDEQFLKNLGLDRRLRPDDFSWLVRFANTNSTRVPFDHGAPLTSNWLFSAHGTACAGLVVASSNIVNQQAENMRAQGTAELPMSLAYAGVDPFSKLLSITTTFAPKPETLILAFFYAALKNADVILVPRGISSELMEPDGEEAEENPAANGRRRAWRVLRATILAISERIPIVCAAGNEAESRLIAPAALAVENEGRNGIIAVGAINYEGMRSSYSSYGPGLTVVGPSDDGEMFNEDQVRLDKTNRFFRDYPYEATARRAKIEEFTYGQPSVLAIDVPGAFGFEDSGNQLNIANQPVTPFSGFFSEFGGTSAAASIVAGVAALVQRAAKRKGAPLRGPEVRKILVATACKEGKKLPHADETKEPTPDIINAHGSKVHLTFEQAFGGGVVNALAAVTAVG